VSTLTISIARTSLSLSPLVLSAADDATALGIADYTEPAIQQRVKYAPDSDYVHGSTALASSLQQTMLNFDVSTDLAASESAARALIAELRTALGQFSYNVTVTVDGSTAEVWACDPGSVGTVSRTFENLKSHNAVYPVSIPCHPVRS
jgi:hypothetical protein